MKVGQQITYRNSASLYFGIITQVKGDYAVVVNLTDPASVALYKAGVAIGCDVHKEQIEKCSENVVQGLVMLYRADPNCWPDLWINDCLKQGEVTKEERDEFMSIVQTRKAV